MRKRDYVPCREKNLDARMKQGGSVKDGLSGRAEAQKEGVSYRKYLSQDGSEDTMKKWTGNVPFGEY